MNNKVISFENAKNIIQKNSTFRKILSDKRKLYILIGIPGSGKTYYAEHFLMDVNTIIVSTDEIRKETFGTYSFSISTNNLIINTAKQRIEKGLAENQNIIFDATNINKRNRNSIIKIGKKYNATVIAIVFKTSLSLCIYRNRQRTLERRVPEDKLILMADFNSNIDKSEEGFDSVVYLE